MNISEICWGEPNQIKFSVQVQMQPVLKSSILVHHVVMSYLPWTVPTITSVLFYCRVNTTIMYIHVLIQYIITVLWGRWKWNFTILCFSLHSIHRLVTDRLFINLYSWSWRKSIWSKFTHCVYASMVTVKKDQCYLPQESKKFLQNTKRDLVALILRVHLHCKLEISLAIPKMRMLPAFSDRNQ